MIWLFIGWEPRTNGRFLAGCLSLACGEGGGLSVFSPLASAIGYWARTTRWADWWRKGCCAKPWSLPGALTRVPTSCIWKTRDPGMGFQWWWAHPAQARSNVLSSQLALWKMQSGYQKPSPPTIPTRSIESAGCRMICSTRLLIWVPKYKTSNDGLFWSQAL